MRRGTSPNLLRFPRLAGLATAAAVLPSAVAQAAAEGLRWPSPAFFDAGSAMSVAVPLGLIIFTTVLAIAYLRERQGWTEKERALGRELAALRSAAERADLLMGAERQAVVAWDGAGSAPVVEGDPTVAGPGAGPKRVLAFGTWIAGADAGRIETAATALKERGEFFGLTCRTVAGGWVEAEGRTVAGRALLRLRDVTGERAALLRVEAEAAGAQDALGTLRGLLDAIDEPVWLRGPGGRLTYANRAYLAAVEAPSVETGSGRSPELLDRSDRETAEFRRGRGETYRARVAAIMAGARRMLDITEAPLASGAAGGIARDVSENDTLRADVARSDAAHRRLLDQLPTAVAVFDGVQRLVFHNTAYRELWNLDSAFLESGPSEGEILDALRSERRLPEQADYRSWKSEVLAGYRSDETGESWWHLPDRRTLRVVRSPNGQGGLTALFDDVSDRMQLESRYNALIRNQRETLDTLAEGVALFGTDGRLRLFNRAFAELWRLDRDALDSAPHIEAVVELGRRLAPVEAPWADIKSAVFGFSDMRLRTTGRMERLDGSVLDWAAEPLPDGATLITFADVTATANVERALTERNEALEVASRIRNDFVHHVSYELRSPLTTVIGFAELLGAETAGPLNERQRDYADHITRSSGALLAIINDILDLASIDADTIELAREPVDIRGTIDSASAGIHDRLVEASLLLEIDAPADLGSFVGDSKRVRQVLYNLLSNAAAFSLPGQTIRVTARKVEGEAVISVSDQGRGIPAEVQARVFDRFESRAGGAGRRGVGLGLSIVRSFVELHGGRVELVSEAGAGTTVTCHFPANGPKERQLAASLDGGEPDA